MFVLSLHPVWNLWWIEKSLMRRFAALSILVCVVIAFGFLAWPSHVQAPLIVSGVTGNNKPGADIHGIKWQSYYSELRITFMNPTEDDYKNLDVSVFIPNLAVMGIAETTNLPNVLFGRVSMFGSRSPGMILWSANEPYRIRADVLPRRGRFQMVFALAALKENLAELDLSSETASDFSFLFDEKRAASDVTVTGQYQIGSEIRKVSEKLLSGK
jgi:hypothetical protein